MEPGWLLLAGLGAPFGALMLAGSYHQDNRRIAVELRRLAEARTTAAEPPGGRASDPEDEIAAALERLRQARRERDVETAARLGAIESILEALPDPLILVNAERAVVRANGAARGLFGEHMLERDLAASLRYPTILEAVDAVLGGAKTRTVELILPVPVERSFEARIKPFRRSTEASAGVAPALSVPTIDGEAAVMLALHDITAIRRSEQMRADFVANASHELRTPLSSLLGFIETLRGPAREDREARERFLGIMFEQAARMSRLVDDLLSLSRIELDEHRTPTGQVDLVQVVRTLVRSFELKVAARSISLRIDAAEVLPAVTGDEDQIAQVVQNLISNAVKYAREGTEVIIRVGAIDGAAIGGGAVAVPVFGLRRTSNRSSARMVALAVIDRGEGIARTHLPRLTERFYRVDPARSRALGGTGLGLAIVKHIVNRHRGRLSIESELGQGSTFTVFLPIAREQSAQAPGQALASGR
ncbi:MAG: PAS domain-containing sensor histidine kinase [Azospirillum sp.]|nr:PAS domain-containing sensor histidine kinase [Azospirillum sp.]